MLSSWKIGQFAGIGVYVHWSFLIVPALAGFSALEAGIGAAFSAVLLILTVFACVVLHEFGHALTARQFGVGTRDITLYPIGGVARLERIPEKPFHEFLIAIAGPAVNVVIAGVLLAVLILVAGIRPDLPKLELGWYEFLNSLFIVNVMLVAFNMLPAFPMDGGRVLRSVLAVFVRYDHATRIAFWVGCVMAALFVGFGLVFSQYMLLFIAFFVFLAGRAEARAAAMRVQQQEAMAGNASGGRLRVGDVMRTQFQVLQADSTLHDSSSQIFDGDQDEFPVVSGSQVVGVISREAAAATIKIHGDHLPLREAMQQRFPVVAPNDLLDQAVAFAAESQKVSLPVLSFGRLVGLLQLPKRPASKILSTEVLPQSGA